MRFPNYRQLDGKDCGPTCLKIIAKHYGKSISIKRLRELSETFRLGTSLEGLSNAAESLEFRSLGVKITLEKLSKAPLPCILHWNKSHFVVLYKIKKKGLNSEYYVSDPAFGLLQYDRQEFLKCWIGNNSTSQTEEGICLLMSPNAKFNQSSFNEKEESFSLNFLSNYLHPYKKYIWQLFFGLVGGSIIQLIFPFLTQSIVDVGIKNQDINFIYLILLAQLFLFFGTTGIEIIRGWILLHLSTRINISLLSDFFIKLMNLPISFFDTRINGDILQRINDHKRIDALLTTSSLNVLFSLINILTFGIVLAYYNFLIFCIFFTGTILYLIWIALFLRKRAILDYKKFSQISDEQSQVIEIIEGMQEIKLHNAEKEKRWAWEYLQGRLFKISIEELKLEQYQNIGSKFLNELKNILITVLSAKFVIDGEITLGIMLAISFIIGQLNSPISSISSFIQELQDAKISIDRLSEIHNKKGEENSDTVSQFRLTGDLTIKFSNVSFRYVGSSNNVLNNINLVIPENKMTAIVGYSGSGKTTLMKLILRFYEPQKGVITVGKNKLAKISQKAWRNYSGTVMQEGYIFSDTVANNIAIGVDEINHNKLINAARVANIDEFIETLPQSYNTKIGRAGVGLSAGQKQRILIARAVYKDPKILLFDEATSALDAHNEKVIMENLNLFFKKKTVITIAHRLSTVKNADQIVVMDKGRIVEIGNHYELSNNKGTYYNLVKNQLELGS